MCSEIRDLEKISMGYVLNSEKVRLRPIVNARRTTSACRQLLQILCSFTLAKSGCAPAD